MGVDISTWRSRIGCFVQPRKSLAWKVPAIFLGKRALGVYRTFVLALMLYAFALNNATHSTGSLKSPTNNNVARWSVSRQPSLLNNGLMPATQGSAHLYLVSEMALLRSGLETNPGPTPDYCVEGCKKNRKETGDMIRCCMCAHWFHLECLNLSKAEATGVWPCLECRLLCKKVRLSQNICQRWET